MNKLWAIIRNTFVQTIRQPIYGVLIFAMFGVLVLCVPMSVWTVGNDYHGSDQKMFESLGLSTLLIAGLLIAAFSASSVVSREIDDKTAQTVVTKPVSRSMFLLGKYIGVAAAITMAFYLGSAVFLMALRHKVVPAASDPYDWPVIVLGFASLAIIFIVAIAGNLLFRWTFTSGAVWTAMVVLTVALGAILCVGKGWQIVPPGYDKPPAAEYGVVKVTLAPDLQLENFQAYAATRDYQFEGQKPETGEITLRHPVNIETSAALTNVATWPGVQSVGLILPARVITGQMVLAICLLLLAVLVFGAVAVAASTRLGQLMTLMVCIGVYIIGSMHSFLFGQLGGAFIVRAAGWIVPNLTYFYPFDSLIYAIDITPQYMLFAGGYALAYIAAALLIGMAMLQNRELEARESSGSLPGAVGLLAGAGRIAAIAMVIVGLTMLTLPAFHNINGLLVAAALLVLAPAGWMLWGAFSRGKVWTYWTVLLTATLAVAALCASMFVPGKLGDELTNRPVPMLMGAGSAVLMVIILMLPKTRRHFVS